MPAGRARDLVGEQLARYGRLIELEARLADANAGAEQLDPAECVEFARLCRIRKDYESAARFLASAFARSPALAEDVVAGRR